MSNQIRELVKKARQAPIHIQGLLAYSKARAITKLSAANAFIISSNEEDLEIRKSANTKATLLKIIQPVKPVAIAFFLVTDSYAVFIVTYFLDINEPPN